MWQSRTKAYNAVKCHTASCLAVLFSHQLKIDTFVMEQVAEHLVRSHLCKTVRTDNFWKDRKSVDSNYV
jgi:hypothetical protein